MKRGTIEKKKLMSDEDVDLNGKAYAQNKTAIQVSVPRPLRSNTEQATHRYCHSALCTYEKAGDGNGWQMPGMLTKALWKNGLSLN